MSFKPIDARRDEYRKYLERTGVLETLNKVILELYEVPDPRPENAIEFVRRSFGDSMVDSDTIEQLKRELEDSRNEVAKLEKQLETVQLEITRQTVPDNTSSVPAETMDASANEDEIVLNETVSKEICSSVNDSSDTVLKAEEDIDEANQLNEEIGEVNQPNVKIVDADEEDEIEKEVRFDKLVENVKNDESDCQNDAEIKNQENGEVIQTETIITSVEDENKAKPADSCKI